MKILSLMAGMLVLIIASTISPTSLNGRFVVINSDNFKLAVLLQINTNTGIDDLGGATIVIGFDKTILNYSSNPIKQTDFTFHRFNEGNYNTATVTRPMIDKLWINIDLPSKNNNNGTIVSGDNNWTDIVTLYFDLIAPQDTVKLKWLSDNSFWSIYDGDNRNLWTNGTLTNLEIIASADVTPPDLVGVTATNNKSLTVKFSEKLDPNTAKNKNNYNISNNILINQVQISPDSSSVVLKTSQQQSNIDYTLTIMEIKDLYGNIISPNPRTIEYRISSKSRGGSKIINPVTSVIATSWEQNYSPDKTIDGFGLNTPDSRWQSAKLMPDTITYDLGENVSLDSLRISFYKGDAGRLYKYSVYSSNDLNNWSSIADDIWSEETEWTEVEFDSTRGRYIKLILKESNQGKSASIWEFESYGLETKDTKQSTGNPEEFTLLQNYPNPFNPSTTISWQSPVGSMQTLKVYDILGNEVATLVNEFMDAGQHEVEFEATNLASGIYVYRLQTGGFIETKKMVLLR